MRPAPLFALHPDMRRSLRLVPAAVCLILWTLPLHGQGRTDLALFEEANQLYAREAYREALNGYLQVEARGVVSSALYYNTGNAYFRLNEIGRAILYYERARRLNPSDPNLLHSLGVARSRTEDRITHIPEPVWTRAWNQVTARLGARGLFAVGLLLYLFAIGLVAQRIWTGQPNDWLRRGMFVGFVGGCVCLAGALLTSFQAATDHVAVVTETRAQIREDPAAGAGVAYEVHEGLVVDVLGRQTGWIEVRLPNGTTGWIPADDVVEV